jgi:hypothetical protein
LFRKIPILLFCSGFVQVDSFAFVLFCSVLFCSVPFHSVLFCSVPFRSVPFCSVLSFVLG